MLSISCGEVLLEWKVPSYSLLEVQSLKKKTNNKEAISVAETSSISPAGDVDCKSGCAPNSGFWIQECLSQLFHFLPFFVICSFESLILNEQ
jgi:hypothetical protein